MIDRWIAEQGRCREDRGGGGTRHDADHGLLRRRGAAVLAAIPERRQARRDDVGWSGEKGRLHVHAGSPHLLPGVAEDVQTEHADREERGRWCRELDRKLVTEQAILRLVV